MSKKQTNGNLKVVVSRRRKSGVTTTTMSDGSVVISVKLSESPEWKETEKGEKIKLWRRCRDKDEGDDDGHE